MKSLTKVKLHPTSSSTIFFDVGCICPGLKDTLTKSLQSYVVYQFACAGCEACYIGETKHYLNTRIEEHLGKDEKSHIYSHLQENLQR